MLDNPTVEIYKQGKHTLSRSTTKYGDRYLYTISDENGEIIHRWTTEEQINPIINPEDEEEFYDSDVYVYFQSILNKLVTKKTIKKSKDPFVDDPADKKLPPVTNKNITTPLKTNYWTSGGTYKGGTSYTYKPTYKKGYVEKYNKSNTLVFHKEDPSTTMLSQIYEGKGWDVITDTGVDPEEVKELMLSHERIVCLGHGHSGGLCGGMITDREAPYFKDKKIFAIWCNADAYFAKHNIGKGQFITGNMPSEVWECQAAGCGEISAELMLENITYWSKLCADHVEQCLEGNVHQAVAEIRKDYLEHYGDHAVTIYNAERTQAFQEPDPLPEYDCKGVHYTPENYPKPVIKKYTASASSTYNSSLWDDDDDFDYYDYYDVPKPGTKSTYTNKTPTEDLSKYPTIFKDMMIELNVPTLKQLCMAFDKFVQEAMPESITVGTQKYITRYSICELRDASNPNNYLSAWSNDFRTILFVQTGLYDSQDSNYVGDIVSDKITIDFKELKTLKELKDKIVNLTNKLVADFKDGKVKPEEYIYN